jgi:hypothetical protein
VVGNHLHHAVRELCDGAGFYALGCQPGSLLAGNHIHDIRRLPDAHGAPIAGIYLDEGSLGWTVTGNLVHDTDDRPVNLHRPGMTKADVPPPTPAEFTNVFRGNILVVAADGTAGQRQPPYGQRQQLYGAEPRRDAIVIWDDNRLIARGAWADERAAVLAAFPAAGPRP